MENVYMKHHDIKNQLRQIITEEYQDKNDFVCIPSDDPYADINSFKQSVSDKFSKEKNFTVNLEKYIYIIPDVRKNRLVIRF